jgi:DNA-binding Xre family transcriptional regulator
VTRQQRSSLPRRLVINWAVVEQRRIAAGIGHAELRDRVGASPVTGPPRIWRDSDHDSVRLGILERLCQVLDLHPVELFAAPFRPAQPTAEPPAEAEDEQVLEAALASLTAAAVARASLGHPGPVSRGALADALGWPLARLLEALATLETGLATRGHRIDTDLLTEARPRHGLRPRDQLLTSSQRDALHRLGLINQPLDPETARVLYEAAQPDGRCVEYHAAIGYNAAVLLQQQGLIQRRRGAHYLELTDDVRFALLLDVTTTDAAGH